MNPLPIVLLFNWPIAAQSFCSLVVVYGSQESGQNWKIGVASAIAATVAVDGDPSPRISAIFFEGAPAGQSELFFAAWEYFGEKSICGDPDRLAFWSASTKERLIEVLVLFSQTLRFALHSETVDRPTLLKR